MKLSAEQLEIISQDPKAFFGRAFRVQEKIQARYERIEYWRQHAEQITAQLKPVVVSSSTVSNKPETCIISIMEIEDEIKQQIQDLAGIHQEIEIAIKTLVADQSLQTLMELRYLNYLRWEEIAVRLGYTFRWTMTLHKRALEEIQQESASIHAALAL